MGLFDKITGIFKKKEVTEAVVAKGAPEIALIEQAAKAVKPQESKQPTEMKEPTKWGRLTGKFKKITKEKKCPKCGKSFPGNYEYCEDCGTKLEATSTEKAEKTYRVIFSSIYTGLAYFLLTAYGAFDFLFGLIDEQMIPSMFRPLTQDILFWLPFVAMGVVFAMLYLLVRKWTVSSIIGIGALIVIVTTLPTTVPAISNMFCASYPGVCIGIPPVYGQPEVEERGGCRDCLEVKLDIPTSARNNQPYRFVVNLRNKDCLLLEEDDKKYCTSKKLEDIVVYSGAYAKNAYIPSDQSYAVPTLEPCIREDPNCAQGSYSVGPTISGISSDVFTKRKFNLNITTDYSINTTASGQLTVLKSYKDIGRFKAMKAVTDAGPVDIIFKFIPTNEFAIDMHQPPITLQLGFKLVANGEAEIKNLKIVQYASQANALKIKKCDFTYTEEIKEDSIVYMIDTTDMQKLTRMPESVSDEYYIFCDFDPPTFEGSYQITTFTAESYVMFSKIFESKAINIID